MKTAVRDTSLLAYTNKVLPTLSDREKAVYDVLDEAGENLTNNEIAARLNWTINRVTGRIFGLRQKGYVYDDGKRICRCTGEECHAWNITRDTLF